MFIHYSIRMKRKTEDIGIVVAAGGSGARFGTGNKLLEYLAGKPVLIHSLAAFAKACPGSSIVVPSPSDLKGRFAELAAEFLPGAMISFVDGGNTRMRSVFNGLLALPTTAEFAAVHDAARPLAGARLITDCIRTARRLGSAVAARRATDTVKRADSRCLVLETLDRERLWFIETPQIFRASELISAYRKAFAEGIEATDDAGVMEAAGRKVFLLENRTPNIKITSRSDLAYAKYLLERKL